MLSEYTQFPVDQYFMSDTTFVFLPGDHILENSVLVNDVTNLVLRGDSASPSSTIVYRGAMPIFFFLNVTGLHIASLAFEGNYSTVMLLQLINFSYITSCFFQRSSLVFDNSELVLSNNTFEDNEASFGGGVSVISSTVSFFGNSFRNIAVRRSGAAVFVDKGTVSFTENLFASNTANEGGGAVSLRTSWADFVGNSFVNNYALLGNNLNNLPTGFGGAVSILNSTTSFSGNTFTNNTAGQRGGAIQIQDCDYVSFTDNAFVNNTAYESGGAVSIVGSAVNFTGNVFVMNYALSTGFNSQGDSFIVGFGGGADILNSTITFIGNAFVNNTAGEEGGGAIIVCSEWNISHNTFQRNMVMVNSGGGLSIQDGTGILDGNEFIHNTAVGFGGGVSITQVASATFAGKTSFLYNTVERFIGGGIYMQDSNFVFKGDTIFVMNLAPLLGGAVIVFNTNVTFEGTVSLEGNAADSGAAIMAVRSFLFFEDSIYFLSNEAMYGAGIYARETNITFNRYTTFYNNSAVINGGAVFASGSNLHFDGSSNFTRNTASNGGGLFLTSISRLYFFTDTLMFFDSNYARQTGGAITVEDDTPLAYCNPDRDVLDILSVDCFFQLFPNQSILQPVFVFLNNTASNGGGDLYGGTIDACSLPNVSSNIMCDSCDTASSREVFNFLFGSRYQSLTVSSVPLRTCVCDTNYYSCPESPIPMQIYPGQAVRISVIALGQNNGTTASVVLTELDERRIRITDLEYTQSTTTTCTNLHYTILTSAPSSQEELALYPAGPCEKQGQSLTISVEILPCPLGFQQSEQACVCDERLNDLTDVCDIDSQTILRPRGSEFWVGFDGDSQKLIIHPQCPFDYCTRDEKLVKVDDSDTQCNYNRIGKLCGSCSGNTSLALGSSRCMQCSNGYLALIIAFAVAGIALVLFLFILKLTVAVGTINGLIFYANLVQVNSSVFYKSVNTNLLTVFISWINLDLGIETCFYKGMDVYAKTWLQFVFPIYIWSLVGVIIFLSHFSRKITSLLGSNPIAVLATLFLLSYAKILRTIIAAFSLTYLQYPDGINVAVWSYDGNIEYFNGKHIPLFIIALLSLIFLFLPFTLLLFLGQWIQTLQAKTEWRILSWINKPTFRAFLDAYHAPYACSHRYWTGLLLLVRSILLIIFATIGNTSADLLAVSSAVTGLITFALAAAGIYQKHYFGILEASFFLNLVLLTTATYHVEAVGGNQAAVTLISLGIAFTTFAGIVIYHIFLQSRGTKLWERVVGRIAMYGKRLSKKDSDFQRKKDSGLPPEVPVTTTFLELREPMLDEC